jgi:DNA replication protein DnaC
MQNGVKILCSFLLISIVFISGLMSNGLEEKGDEEKTNNLKIVFVVDVSYSLKDNAQLVLSFVKDVYKSFDNANNDFHLITFSYTAKLFDPLNDIKLTSSNIKNEYSKSRKYYDTFPKQGLCEVFDLVEIDFPKKKGIVLFISDGEDSRNEFERKGYKKKPYYHKKVRDDLRRTIGALRSNGFTVFSIFVPGMEKYICESCMEKIAEWSGKKPEKLIHSDDIPRILAFLELEFSKIKFNSPLSRSDFVRAKKSWDSQNKSLNDQLYKEELENSNLLSLIYALIFALFLLILVFTFQIMRLKKTIKTISEKAPSIDMLWGKIEHKDLNGKTQEDNLSWLKVNEVVKPPDGFPELKFSCENRDGRKVITVQTEKGRIEFLNEHETPCNNDYIDLETRFIRIVDPQKKRSFLYKYNFLNKLLESYEQPVWDNYDGFKGREEIIEDIKNNFIKESPDHLIISGVANVGKTSLIMNLYYEVFRKDKVLSSKYDTAFLEYNIEETHKYPDFRKLFEEKADLLLKNERKKKIMIIDDYDEIIDTSDKSGSAFVDLIKECVARYNMLFILSGKKNRSLIDKNIADQFPLHFHPIILSGLDMLKNDSIKKQSYKPNNSIDLINFLLSEVGLPHGFLGEDIKIKIADFVGGFPYLIKRTLYTLITNWINNYDKHSLTLEDAWYAITTVADTCKDYIINRALEIDEKEVDPLDVPIREVRIRDILISLSIGKGILEKEFVKKELVYDYHRHDPDGKIVEKREESFNKKIKNLINMGLIIEDGKYLIGIPRIFFYKGEWIFDNSTINK